MPKLRKRAVPRYRELVDYCQTTFDETGTMPSYSTIAEALRFHDRSTVVEPSCVLKSVGCCTARENGGAGKVSERVSGFDWGQNPKSDRGEFARASYRGSDPVKTCLSTLGN